MDARGDLEFARASLSHARLVILVDSERNARGAVLSQQRTNAVHALLAILEVDRVDDRFSAVALQTFLDHARVGRVKHDRRVHLTHEARGHLGHVLRAAASNKVHAHIEHLPAILDLLAGHRHQSVEVAFVEQTLEFARSVGVGALGDNEERVLLHKLHIAIEARGTRRLRSDAALGLLAVETEVIDHGAQFANVLRRGAAAAADRTDLEFLDETPHRLTERLGLQRILRASINKNRQTSVGQHADRAIPVAGDVGDMLRHLNGTSRAIEAQRRDRKRLERVHHRRDIGAKQHGAGGFDGHARENRAILGRESSLAKRVDAGIDRDLLLKKVLRCLDHEPVDAAGNQPARLLEIAGVHLVPRCLPQRNQLGSRPHRADGESRAIAGFKLGASGARNLGGALVEVEGPRSKLLVELASHQDVGAEGVGLNDVGANGEVSFVNALNDVGAAADKDVGAVVAAEVVAGIAVCARMNLRAHAAVKNEGARFECLQKGTLHGAGGYDDRPLHSTIHPDEWMKQARKFPPKF